MVSETNEQDIVVDIKGVLEGDNLSRFASMENAGDIIIFIVKRKTDGAKDKDIIKELRFQFEIEDAEFSEALIAAAQKVLNSKEVGCICSRSKRKTIGWSLIFVAVVLVIGWIFNLKEWYLASGVALLLAVISVIQAIFRGCKR